METAGEGAIGLNARPSLEKLYKGPDSKMLQSDRPPHPPAGVELSLIAESVMDGVWECDLGMISEIEDLLNNPHHTHAHTHRHAQHTHANKQMGHFLALLENAHM